MSDPRRARDLATLQQRHARRWSTSHRLMLWSALLLLAFGVTVLLLGRSGSQTVSYRSIEAKRGSLVVTVTSTGTLQPVNQVEIGSELSGTIATVEVDYNDQVTVGQILARLDTEILNARITEAKAAVQSAKAGMAEAAASVTETHVNLVRCQQLLSKQMCTPSDLDRLQAAYERALASEVMMKERTLMAQAALEVHEINLRKAVISSPISGVVLNRKVEPGQTVAASFQTPVLFTIAEDLKQMALRVAVDEADVGRVRTGQSASFTVDAFPRRAFRAQVRQIRQAPRTIDGVVTYETVLAVDNSDLSLMPGMTATAQIVVAQFKDELLVPNAALRFSPPDTTPARERAGFAFSLLPLGAPPAPQKAQKPNGLKRGTQVWIARAGIPEAIPVTTGASDGRWTVVTEGEVREGDALLVEAVITEK